MPSFCQDGELLTQLMLKLKDIEKASAEAPQQTAPKEHPSVDLVEQMVKAIASKRQEDEDLPLEENKLEACMLMAGRRYGDEAFRREEAEPSKAALETRELLTRFAEGGPDFSVGAASKTDVFRAIVLCFSELQDSVVAEFKADGGFARENRRTLPDHIADQAKTKKRAVMLSGDVFKMSFEKPRWANLRRAAKHLPWIADAKEPAATAASGAKDEL
eukprot:TRINITY_DN3264_c0_g3_i1.p1 TRINITY_DN3264_c0_g3~~TRINITY_DN3264_c0_g3_i1.p1  ORF type:complete len:217 (+),score=54.48 TRINITY_DN3264_c0_g3_i1:378-1028(+)